MKFQMKSQQKKNEKKQQRFFLELQKQQEALVKRLSNNQPRDSTTIFTQNALWNALETFSYAPLRHITEDMKISILPTVPIGLMQKKVRLLREKLGTVEHNKFVDYILPKKNLRTWLFRNS